MWLLRIMGILALVISFLLSAGSVQNAWEDKFSLLRGFTVFPMFLNS